MKRARSNRTPAEGTVLREVRVIAPAKINWALTIRRRREDGFHDIDTVFQTISLTDELICRPARKPRCSIRTDNPEVPIGPENLIARAWELLRRRLGARVGGMDVELIKRIPMGAGLGGGSSDAAAALLAVDRLWGLGLRAAELEASAAELGSDCAFFIRGGTAQACGRGERLTPIPNRLPPRWMVVVFPGFPSSTAQAYGRANPSHWEGPERVERVARALANGDPAQLEQSSCNVFSELVSDAEIRYKHVYQLTREVRLTGAMLSGSGSSIFAFASSSAHARDACRELRRRYPQTYVVRPRRVGVRVVRQRIDPATT